MRGGGSGRGVEGRSWRDGDFNRQQVTQYYPVGSRHHTIVLVGGGRVGDWDGAWRGGIYIGYNPNQCLFGFCFA